MLVYIFLILFFILGHFLYYSRVISKKSYCVASCLFLTVICGLRNVTVGMWDTVAVYLPSFKVINQNSISELLKLSDTQYKFIGFDVYTKLIGLISHNEQFYLFMMAWPFFVAISYLIYSYSEIPLYSFIALAAFGYLTYSFSMIRGMLSLAILALALDAAIKEKWRSFLALVGIASLFHITSLIFLSVYFIKRIRWTINKVLVIVFALIAGQKIFPVIWQWFVTSFISGWLKTYNYYATKGGVLADALLCVYIITCIVAIIKQSLSARKVKKNECVPLVKMWIKKGSIGTNRCTAEDVQYNLFLGMSILASVLIVFTSILSEMIRIAMILGIGCILLAGKRISGYKGRNTVYICFGEWIQLIVYIGYFFLAALPNMNAIPYTFFWQ